MSENRVATATTAEWDFHSDMDLVANLLQAARSVFSMFKDRLCIEIDDLFQDALLYVAVRPEKHELWQEIPAYAYRDVRMSLMRKCDREVLGDYSLDVLLESELV